EAGGARGHVEEVGVRLEVGQRCRRVVVLRAAGGLILRAAIDRVDREREVDADQKVAAAAVRGELLALGDAVAVRDRRARPRRDARVAARLLRGRALLERAVEAVRVAG